MKKTVIVTGSSGGIGSVISQELIRRGYYTIDLDIHEPNDSSDARKRQPIADGLSRFVRVDVSNEDEVKDFFESINDDSVVGLVNAAGVSPKSAGGQIMATDLDGKSWDSVMAINTKSVFLMSKYAKKLLSGRVNASIVNLHSISGTLGAGGGPEAKFPPYYAIGLHYAASKAAVESLTVSLSKEFAAAGIRVNGVAPGLVNTALTQVMPDDARKKAVSQVPMQRMAEPHEIANVVAFLLNEESSYVTGASISVTGGW